MSKKSACCAALGGGRLQLVRAHLAESLILSVAGCGAGFAFAAVAARWLDASLADSLPVGVRVTVDARGAAFAVLISVGCTSNQPVEEPASAAPAHESVKDEPREPQYLRQRGVLGCGAPG